MSIAIAPPQLPGYDVVQRLGSGAAATVFLYNQQMPQRPVAIKVSNAALDPASAVTFHREANFMARLSSNPYILTVYDAGITPDGHGYMVMEYAPGGSYSDKVQSRSMDCDQVLDLGIKLAGALFCAHRSNIIHHDIKPSNILITAQGVPALSDFGISTDAYDHTDTGFSLPWAPPEVIEHRSNGSESADIYSLGATLYALLAGSSPYQHTYHPRTQAELANLIINSPLPPIQRPDIPANVESVLGKALAKEPDQRYYSALEFAQAMQRVQQTEYGHTTAITAEGIPAYPDDTTRQRRTSTDQGSGPSHRHWGKRTAIAITLVTVIAALCLSVIIAAPSFTSAHAPHANARDANMPDKENNQAEDTVTGTANGQIPSPQNLSGQYAVDGSSVTFTWTNPSPQQGDSYAWSFVQNDASDIGAQATITSATSISVAPQDGAQTCIQVSIIRSDRHMSANPAIACAVRP